MNFDSLLSQIKGFGKFQIALILIQTISRMTLPCHFLLNNFITEVPSHHCDLGALDDGGTFRNLTAAQKVTVGVPALPDGTPSVCRMFSEPQYHLLSMSNTSNVTDSVQCQSGWVYDHSTFKSTLATEWDLVCSKKWMNKATATILFVGVMCGAPLFGYLSDRFGRRKTLLVSYLFTMVFAVLSSFSTSYVMFSIMRFFTGVTLSGISVISLVLSVEWIGIEHRTLAGVLISLDWTIGSWLLTGIGYFVNEWRMLILVVTSPLLFSILTWWWLPESARWLLAHGKSDAAHFYILKCAKMNNRTECLDAITPVTLLESDVTQRKDKKYTFVDLVRTPTMRKIAICSGIVWYGVAFTYYGISLNISGFGLNLYLSQFVFTTIEMPGKIMVYYFLLKMGRRLSQAGSLMLTGVCIFINLFIPKDQWIARTVMAVLGKGLSEASFTIMFLYTSELYPTVVRQNGLGYTSFVARLGVSIAPLILLLDEVWHLLPSVIYCVVAVGASLVTMLLPETMNARLPELIEDVEEPRERHATENT